MSTRRPCSGRRARWPTSSTPPGAPGRTAFWVNARAELLGTLDAWLTYDRSGWAGRAVAVVGAGLRRRERVELVLPDGRTRRLQGQDRPHRRAARRHPRRHRPQDGQARRAGQAVAADDPTLNGPRYQLPVYAAAARVLVGRSDALVRAGYTYFRPNSRASGSCSTTTSGATGRRDLARVVAGIEAGVYPADPRAAGMAALRGVLVLRPRRPRNGAAHGPSGSASEPDPTLAPRGSPTRPST